MEDIDFDVSGKRGYIIVSADQEECLKLAFDDSISVKIVFTILKDSCLDLDTSEVFRFNLVEQKRKEVLNTSSTVSKVNELFAKQKQVPATSPTVVSSRGDDQQRHQGFVSDLVNMSDHIDKSASSFVTGVANKIKSSLKGSDDVQIPESSQSAELPASCSVESISHHSKVSSPQTEKETQAVADKQIRPTDSSGPASFNASTQTYKVFKKNEVTVPLKGDGIHTNLNLVKESEVAGTSGLARDEAASGFLNKDGDVNTENTTAKPGHASVACGTADDDDAVRDEDMENVETGRDQKDEDMENVETGRDQKDEDSEIEESDADSEDAYLSAARGKTFSCPQCNQVFKTQSTFRRHLKVHDEPTVDSVYQCGVCKEKFPNFADYEKHQNEAVCVNKSCHPCTVCWEEFSTSSEQRKHMDSVHGEFNEDPADMYRRIRLRKKIKKFKKGPCNICGIVCLTMEEWSIHKRFGHVKTCKICKQTFDTKGLLWLHLRENHSEDKDSDGNLLLKKCSKCHFQTLSQNTLRRHLNTHKETPAMSICDYCGKSFNSRAILLHIKFKHPTAASRSAENQVEKHPCEICGKLVKKFGMNWHKRTYHMGKAFKCKLCSKAFVCVSRLRRHQLIHTEEKPYKCEVCSKCFNQACNLAIHMRTHTKERPFQCQFCDLAFSHKCTLQGHVERKHNMQNLA